MRTDNRVPSNLTCVDEGKIEDLPPVLVLSTEQPQEVVFVLARISQDTIGDLYVGSVPQGSSSVSVGRDSQGEKSPPG